MKKLNRCYLCGRVVIRTYDLFFDNCVRVVCCDCWKSKK